MLDNKENFALYILLVHEVILEKFNRKSAEELPQDTSGWKKIENDEKGFARMRFLLWIL